MTIYRSNNNNEDEDDDVLGRYDPEHFDEDDDTRKQLFLTKTILHLTYLRSSYLVGEALANHYPTEDAWEEAVNSPNFADSVGDFHLIVDDIEAETSDPASLLELTDNHYGRAIDAVTDLADHLGVPAADLVHILINT